MFVCTSPGQSSFNVNTLGGGGGVFAGLTQAVGKKWAPISSPVFSSTGVLFNKARKRGEIEIRSLIFRPKASNLLQHLFHSVRLTFFPTFLHLPLHFCSSKQCFSRRGAVTHLITFDSDLNKLKYVSLDRHEILCSYSHS